MLFDRQGKTVGPDQIRATVLGPRFAGFRAATNFGGAYPNGGNRPDPNPPATRPMTDAEKVMADWRARQDRAYVSGQWTPPVVPVQPPGWGVRNP